MSLREDWPVPEVNEFVDAVFRAEDEREKKAFQNALHELEESHGKPHSYALIGVIAANANEHILTVFTENPDRGRKCRP
jgi:hypothetical protein